MLSYPIGRALTGEDGKGHIRDAHIHERGGHQGLVVYKREDILFNPEFRPFINDDRGGDMAQNVGFSGQPTVIHAGVNSGAKLTGTTTSTTANHLIDSSETFNSGVIIVAGMSVKNTTSGNEYATITAVALNDLTLDADIFVSGENYEINPIWVGTAVAGTWNFADGGEISITAASTNDQASFANDALRVWDVEDNGFTTLTGKVDLDIYSELNNDILVYFDFDGTARGDQISLNGFIDTADFGQQSFAIPVATFNFGGDTEINGMTIEIIRSGGPRPTIKFDDIQWEEIGASVEYTTRIKRGERFHVTEIRFALADNETGVVTVAGDTENHSIPNLAYDKILSISALSTGIVFKRVQDGVTLFSVTIKQLGDFLTTGSNIINLISDGTNTFFTLLVVFPEAIVLDGATNDFLSLTINDDLSSLLQFTAAARGAIEI